VPYVPPHPPPVPYTAHLGNISNPIVIHDSPPLVRTRDYPPAGYGLPPPPLPQYPSHPIATRSVTSESAGTKPFLIDRSNPDQSRRPTTPSQESPGSSMTNPVDLTIWYLQIILFPLTIELTTLDRRSHSPAIRI
jgi:hypothetical protein